MHAVKCRARRWLFIRCKDASWRGRSTLIRGQSGKEAVKGAIRAPLDIVVMAGSVEGVFIGQVGPGEVNKKFPEDGFKDITIIHSGVTDRVGTELGRQVGCEGIPLTNGEVEGIVNEITFISIFGGTNPHRFWGAVTSLVYYIKKIGFGAILEQVPAVEKQTGETGGGAAEEVNDAGQIGAGKAAASILEETIHLGTEEEDLIGKIAEQVAP